MDQNSAQQDTQGKDPETKKVHTEHLDVLFSQQSVDPVTFLNVIIHESVGLSSSDIFFEPRQGYIIIRIRIDGVLYQLGKISGDLYTQIGARVKVLCNLDLTKRHKVQEGQFTVDHDGKVVNLRVEIVETVHGELIVIRVHEKKTIVMELSELGFNKDSYDTYMKMAAQRSGLILVCGPTGCGKTTTLYSTLTKINENKEFNVMTIEDPVEFQLDGVNQMQANDARGFTFAVGLKTILRLSPDIVLVGEIRDLETAKIAVESGLTGQLVLSTIHAEDAVGTLFRMRDLGIESYLLNSALRGIVAQRLVRKNCPSCLAPYQPTEDEHQLFVSIMGREPKELFKGTGCSECQNIGYKGRIGIFEVMHLDAKIRDLIRTNVNEEELRETLIKSGFQTLLVDGLNKCEQGVLTIDEVLRNSLRVAI